MKKQPVDTRKAAANDKENGNGKKVAKPTKPADEKFVIGNTNTVRRGFLLEFCDFTRKKGTVDLEMLVKEFSGR
jgi:hypothetical protein